MDPKTASKEIHKLAEQVADLDIPGTLRCAARIVDAADHIRSLAGDAPGDASSFEAKLQPLGKSAWWVPDRNLVAHRGKEAWSFWSFTLLPVYANKRGFREDLGSIVLRPVWRLATDLDVPEMTTKIATRTIERMRLYPTLQDTAQREMAWIDQTFGVKVPDKIATALVCAVGKQARLRWGVNRLLLKDRLIPLDGGKARDLEKWQ